MKKYFRKGIVFTFIFSCFLFLTHSFADNMNLNQASSFYIATNSDIPIIIKPTTKNVIKPDAWYKSSTGFWYYFENNWTTTRTGWFVDPYDGQTFYLNPKDGIMVVGWNTIDGNEYFFKDTMDEEENRVPLGLGFYASLGKGKKSYGSLYKDCMTPDGKFVDKDGKLIK